MKVCPVCKRTYHNSKSFCGNDGAELVPDTITRGLYICVAFSMLCIWATLRFSVLFGLPALVVAYLAFRSARAGQVRWIGGGLLLFAILAVCWGLSIRAFFIASEAMAPTLQVRDIVLVNKLAYCFHSPKVGDIVVFKTPKPIYDRRKPIFIKRVVGLPGDEVSIRVDQSSGNYSGRLYNGEKRVIHPSILGINYTVRVADMKTNQRKLYTSEVVPEGEIYVFGDNSAHSCDSRW